MGTGEHARNRAFKERSRSAVWIGIIVATAVHAALFAYFPDIGVTDIRLSTSEVVTVEVPDDIEIPPPPASIARPATPVIAATDLASEDLTIAPTTFDANPIETLPPPPSNQDEEDLAQAPTFTPMTVRPTLTNSREVAQALERNYPPLLRDAGIGGTALLWFFIDEDGRVVKTVLKESSGYSSFDEAAERVGDLMRFTPAYNRDQRVPVWIAVPVTFEVQR